MARKNRVVAVRPDSTSQRDMITSDTSNSSSIPLLQHLTDGATFEDVDPDACIPLWLVRGLNMNAVLKIKSSISGSSESVSTNLPGLVSGTPSSVLVPLVGNFESILDEWLKDRCKSSEEAALHKAAHEVWYGIVDGCHFHAAVQSKREERNSKLTNFKWRVLVLVPNCTINDLRRLARIQNERSKAKYQFECTVFDLLNGLRQEYEELYKSRMKLSRTGERGVHITHREVAHEYDGGEHAHNTSVKQAVSVAIRLSKKAIEAIGNVVNTDCSDIIFHSPSLNKENHQSKKDVLDNHDCRLFKSFVSFGSLRASKSFMSATSNGLEVAQVNTIYRLKHWSERHKYRAVQANVVTEQFSLAVSAIKEVDRFLDFIGREETYNSMNSVIDNVLRTTECDDELSSNKGNGPELLPSLWDKFRRLHPGKARLLKKRTVGKRLHRLRIQKEQNSSMTNLTIQIHRQLRPLKMILQADRRKKRKRKNRRRYKKRRSGLKSEREND